MLPLSKLLTAHGTWPDWQSDRCLEHIFVIDRSPPTITISNTMIRMLRQWSFIDPPRYITYFVANVTDF